MKTLASKSCLLSFLLCLSAQAGRAVFPGYDAQVIDWNNRSSTNNGGFAGAQNASIKPSTRLAATEFMRAIRNAGFYPGKILRLNLFAGNDFHTGASDTVLGAVQTPLIADKGSAIDVSSQAQGGWTYKEQGSGGGLSDPGASGNLDTGVIPSNDFPANTNIHFFVYVVSQSTEATWSFGGQDGSGHEWGLVGPSFTAVGTRHDICGSGTAYTDNNGSGGYFSQVETTSPQAYKNGVFKASQAPVAQSLPTVTTFVFALNLNGGRSSSTTKTLAGYSFGTKFDNSGLAAPIYYNAWQRFETCLGRQQ